MDSSAEIIRGPNVKETLQSLIGSGQICKLEISRTPYSWLTAVSEIEEGGRGVLLLVDPIRDFEIALSTSRRQDVLVEYLEGDGVPYSFLSRVSQVDPRGIWVKFPERIQRDQKRKFFRLRAPVGTEIFSRRDTEKEEKGTVKDYSLGWRDLLNSQCSHRLNNGRWNKIKVSAENGISRSLILSPFPPLHIY